jgi:hypothetical protein
LLTKIVLVYACGIAIEGRTGHSRGWENEQSSYNLYLLIADYCRYSIKGLVLSYVFVCASRLLMHRHVQSKYDVREPPGLFDFSRSPELRVYDTAALGSSG